MCPCCGRAGNPTGKQLGIIGHGLRERQQRGPLVASGAPQMVTVQVRRYLPFEKRSANLFFHLVTRRYERGSMLITTNQMVTQWGQVFGDEMIAAAVLDRLLHHSHVLVVQGES